MKCNNDSTRKVSDYTFESGSVEQVYVKSMEKTKSGGAKIQKLKL